MQYFRHVLLPRVTIENCDTEWGRYYTTPEGNFPSVTTVLKYSKHFSDEGLKKWKKRVGKEKAEEIKGTALTRGSSIHGLIEKFLNNDPAYSTGEMPFNTMLFNSVKDDLINRLGTIVGIEYPLYSTRLQTAGRADLIAQWDDEFAVIDFKTAKKLKKPEYIESYFAQAATYAIMMDEVFPTLYIKDIVVVILVDHEPKAQIFKDKVENWRELVERIFPLQP